MKKTDVFPKTRIHTILAKVLGTALKYLDFSVISGFPLKTVHPSRNLLAVLSLPPPYTKLKLGKFWIHSSNIVCGVRGSTCVNWKTPQICKSVPRLLSMIVAI